MTKIRITPDYECLRGLLGGDEEAVVELRQGIAEEFARKYLKGLISDEKIARMKKDLEDLIDTRFRELTRIIDQKFTNEIGQIQKRYGEPESLKFSPGMAKLIESNIQGMVYTLTTQLLNEKFSDSQLSDLVMSVLERSITSRVRAYVSAELTSQVQAVIQALSSNQKG